MDAKRKCRTRRSRLRLFFHGLQTTALVFITRCVCCCVFFFFTMIQVNNVRESNSLNCPSFIYDPVQLWGVIFFIARRARAVYCCLVFFVSFGRHRKLISLLLRYNQGPHTASVLLVSALIVCCSDLSFDYPSLTILIDYFLPLVFFFGNSGEPHLRFL